MPSNVEPPVAKPSGIERPENEIVWVKCRGRKSCEGNQAKVLLKKNEGMGGTWIQYVCQKCQTPFSIRL